MAKIFHSIVRCMTDGEITIVGKIYKNDDPNTETLAAHGETAYCQCGGKHSKACAQQILDLEPVVQAAGKNEETGEDIPEIKGPSMRAKIAEWFAQWDLMPEDPLHVAMPKKQVQEKGDNGKMVTKMVDDRDLS